MQNLETDAACHAKQKCYEVHNATGSQLTNSQMDHQTHKNFLLEIKEEQIIETRDKPQCLVAQRLLSHLQYRDATKS